ncbi:hypothetical protein J6S88_06650 [bacterium]|nr:hypothetical protein [bacterium]
MKDFIFEHNLENKMMELISLIQSVKSTLDIMYKASEDTSNDELKQYVDCMILVMETVDLILDKQKNVTQEFQENYCN